MARAGYDTYWMPRTVYAKVPVGKYTWKEAVKAAEGNLLLPDEGFPLDHLTFLGIPSIRDAQSLAMKNSGSNQNMMAMSEINAAKELYGIALNH